MEGSGQAAQQPDFLCVGMQKAGTGWLYDQLQHHGDFWMPPIKELHYFDRGWPDERVLDAIRKRRNPRKKTPDQGWRELTRTDEAFFDAAQAAFSRPMDLESYAGLFALKGGRLSGDITPAYSTLKPELVDAIVQRFPAIRVVLLVREPVARLWSQVAMDDRRGKFDRSLLLDAPALVRHVGGRAYASRSFPTRAADLWGSRLPAAQFQVAFFDDIVGRPQEASAALIRFLGGDPAHQGEVPADFNRKASLSKLDMPAPVRAALVEHFRAELVACRERWGGHCVRWCEMHGIA